MKKILSTAVFFDTSVLVPIVYDRHPNHLKAKNFILNFLKTDLKIVITSQSILEMSTVFSGIYKIPAAEISSLINNFISDPVVTVIYPGMDAVQKFFELIKKYPKSHFTDLFLTAVALTSGYVKIVTNDRDFSMIKELEVCNPFRDN